MGRDWTDKRLDDLARGVDGRFDQVDDRFDRFEGSVDQRFDKVDERFDRVDERFDRVDDRFERVEAEVKTGFASATVEARAASTKLNRTIWAGIVVVGLSKFLFG